MNKNYSGDDSGDHTPGFLADKVDGEEYTIETPNGTTRSSGAVKDGYNGGFGYKPKTTNWAGGNRTGE